MVSSKSGFGSKTEEERQSNIRRASDINSPYNNPCLQEHRLSFECMEKNSYQQSKCELQFANYKVCNEFWNRVRSERRKQGIYPHLPDPEERKKIEAEYFVKHKS